MSRKIPRKLIFCACGCRELIIDRDKQAKPKRYKFGHRNRGVVWVSGETHPNWKGGRRKMTNEYITILNPRHKFASSNGYVPEHRLIWEIEYNASLLSWAAVHHRDHNRQNNVWYNLWAMMKYQHDYLESLGRNRNNKGQFA